MTFCKQKKCKDEYLIDYLCFDIDLSFSSNITINSVISCTVKSCS